MRLSLRRTPVYRRRTPLKRVVLSLLLMVVVGIVGAGGVMLWGMNAVRAPGPLSEPTHVVIEHGKPTTEIGVALEREGVVSDHRLFVITSYLTRASRGGLKAGEYEFPAGASLAQVLSILRSGRSVVHKVTVPEGWTSAQVVERVNAHPALAGSITEMPAEGTLLPDTYVFHAGTRLEGTDLLTAGGRVLNVVGRGPSVPDARAARLAEARKRRRVGTEMHQGVEPVPAAPGSSSQTFSGIGRSFQVSGPTGWSGSMPSMPSTIII